MASTPTSQTKDSFTQSIPIPEHKMGWIIGKNGVFINQLAKRSGAIIVVSDTTSREFGTIWKYVQLTGSSRSIDKAKKLLHLRLDRLEAKDIDKALATVQSPSYVTTTTTTTTASESTMVMMAEMTITEVASDEAEEVE